MINGTKRVLYGGTNWHYNFWSLISCMLKTNSFTDGQGVAGNFPYRLSPMKLPFGSNKGVSFLGVSGCHYSRVQRCLRVLLTLFQKWLQPSCKPVDPSMSDVHGQACGVAVLWRLPDCMSQGDNHLWEAQSPQSVVMALSSPPPVKLICDSYPCAQLTSF